MPFGSRSPMISTRGEKVALDTNVWIFALRKDSNFTA